MEQIVVFQKRPVVVNGATTGYTTNRLELFSKDPFRAVTACTMKSSIMADDYIQMTIVSAEYITFCVGDYCKVNNRLYSIRSMADVTRKGEERFEYNVVMYGVMYELIKRQFRNCDVFGKSSASTFDLTFTLEEFVKVVVYNMNRELPTAQQVWCWGNDNDDSNKPNWPATEPKTISFDKSNCLNALQSICGSSNFDTEFRIEQSWRIDVTTGESICYRTIYVGEFSKTPVNATPYAYGKGEGLYQIKECKVDDSTIINRLWIEGGSENVKSSYRNYAGRLQLPFRRYNVNPHPEVQVGTGVFDRQIIGIADDSKRYIEDPESIARYGVLEGTYQNDDIYPTETWEIKQIGSSNARLRFLCHLGFDLKATWHRDDGTQAFYDDYDEWCYINGYYKSGEDEYYRFCVVNPVYAYTDYLTCKNAYTEHSALTETQFNAIAQANGIVTDYLVMKALDPTNFPDYDHWSQGLDLGILVYHGASVVVGQPASYNAFQSECSNAFATYLELSSHGTTKYLIDSNTPAKVAFKTGKLAGMTFDIANFTKAVVGGKIIGWITINPKPDENGLEFPSADNLPGNPFRFSVGDKFTLVDIFMPKKYYVDAEEELWYDGRKQFEEVRQPSYKYELSIDQLFVKENEQEFRSLVPGNYVRVEDERFFSGLSHNLIDMRISAVEYDMLKQYQYKLTLDNVHKLRKNPIGNTYSMRQHEYNMAVSMTKSVSNPSTRRTGNGVSVSTLRTSTIVAKKDIGDLQAEISDQDTGLEATRNKAIAAYNSASANALMIAKLGANRRTFSSRLVCIDNKLTIGAGVFRDVLMKDLVDCEQFSIEESEIDLSGHEANKDLLVYLHLDKSNKTCKVVVSDDYKDVSNEDPFLLIGSLSPTSAGGQRQLITTCGSSEVNMDFIRGGMLASPSISDPNIKGGVIQHPNGSTIVDITNGNVFYRHSYTSGGQQVTEYKNIEEMLHHSTNGLLARASSLESKVGNANSGLLKEAEDIRTLANSLRTNLIALTCALHGDGLVESFTIPNVDYCPSATDLPDAVVQPQREN